MILYDFINAKSFFNWSKTDEQKPRLENTKRSTGLTLFKLKLLLFNELRNSPVIKINVTEGRLSNCEMRSLIGVNLKKVTSESKSLELFINKPLNNWFINNNWSLGPVELNEFSLLLSEIILKDTNFIEVKPIYFILIK